MIIHNFSFIDDLKANEIAECYRKFKNSSLDLNRLINIIKFICNNITGLERKNFEKIMILMHKEILEMAFALMNKKDENYREPMKIILLMI